MIFLLPRWDMLVYQKVSKSAKICVNSSLNIIGQATAQSRVAQIVTPSPGSRWTPAIKVQVCVCHGWVHIYSNTHHGIETNSWNIKPHKNQWMTIMWFLPGCNVSQWKCKPYYLLLIHTLQCKDLGLTWLTSKVSTKLLISNGCSFLLPSHVFRNRETSSEDKSMRSWTWFS